MGEGKRRFLEEKEKLRVKAQQLIGFCKAIGQHSLEKWSEEVPPGEANR